MAEPNDSGMASLDDSSKDVTPEKPKAIVADLSDDDEEFEDETTLERLIGLSEMFPESVVNFTTVIGSSTKAGVKVSAWAKRYAGFDGYYSTSIIT